MEDAVAQDAGVVYQDVDAAEGDERGLDDLVGVLGLGDRERRGDRLAAAALDLVDHLLRGRGIRAGAFEARADIAHDDGGALARHRQRNAAADAAASAGDDGDFAGHHPGHGAVASIKPWTRLVIGLPPHLVRNLDDAAQFRPLLVLGQQIALLGRGEAALAGNAELVERGVFRRRLDAALELVLAFELAALGGDDAEHDELAFRQHAQRLEAARARIVVFHEISVHLDLAEQDFLHRVVAAGAHEGRFVVAAAQVHGDGHVGGNVTHRRVDEIAVELAEAFGIVAARGHLRPVFRIAQHGDEDLVELEVAATGVGEGAHRLAIGLPEVGEELIEVGIDGLVDGGHHRAAVDRRRGRYGDLRRALGVRLHEFEMLDHRMAGKSELAGDAHPLVAGGDAGKCNAGIHDVAFDAVETPEKIEVPPGATELAVGDGLQPHLLLLLDHAVDLAVLERLELRRADLALRALLARRLQRRRLQEAAHVIGAEWGFASLHDWTYIAVIIAPLWSASSPHLIRHLHDPPQLRPLLVLGQDIAFLARGEAALRGEAELLERDEFRRLVDAAPDRVLGFQRAAF